MVGGINQMHTCPFCDEVCDCDCDDTWGLPVPDDCPHVCDDSSDDDFIIYGDEEEGWDGDLLIPAYT